ncbi:Cyclin-dependent kinases regulatory subunit (Cell division control protein cks1) [Malassezia obtusa]|uniref:Cyclin-dependent kinases regulatory subunit n=1 Tax=Malassezia obtusa TaxID=76774 RepID=A0AAF0E144_9BASI|nr:Cyclin-dependent kinases regulatory subunit (Cell division control protein cks1) [Malassezia obtusa]
MSNEPSYEEYVERHVILPKPFLKRIPKSYFDPEEPGVLRILSDAEWRGIGITQSLGWEHYEVHAPEPHILLFRREKDYQEKYGPHGKPSDAAKIKAANAAHQQNMGGAR